MPARHSFVVDMVEKREDLGNAIALNSTMVNIARLLGTVDSRCINCIDRRRDLFPDKRDKLYFRCYFPVDDGDHSREGKNPENQCAAGAKGRVRLYLWL